MDKNASIKNVINGKNPSKKVNLQPLFFVNCQEKCNLCLDASTAVAGSINENLATIYSINRLNIKDASIPGRMTGKALLEIDNIISTVKDIIIRVESSEAERVSSNISVLPKYFISLHPHLNILVSICNKKVLWQPTIEITKAIKNKIWNSVCIKSPKDVTFDKGTVIASGIANFNNVL